MSFKSLSNCLVSCFTLATVACAPRVEIKGGNPAGTSDKDKDAQTELFDDVDRAFSDAVESGGQPGKITLYGTIANLGRTSGGEGSALQVYAVGGMGWRGARAPVKAENAPAFHDELPTEHVSSLEKDFKTPSLAFGCSKETIEKHFGVSGAETIINDKKLFNDSIKLVRAEKVLLCGQNPLTATTYVSITAKDVVLQDAALDVTGLAGLSIQAENLSSFGRSSIESLAQNEDGKLFGASISISVKESLGLEGSLIIKAQGHDAKKRKK